MILGIPVTARARLRPVVGMLANILPLRLVVNPHAGFNDLLRQVTRRMREALDHQRYRAEDQRADLKLQAYEPELFGTMVNVLSFNYDLRFAGHPIRARNIGNWRTSDFQINVYDRRDYGDVCIEFIANSSHYSSDVLAAHQRRFLALLNKLVPESFDLPLHRLDILDSEERQILLKDVNATAGEIPDTTLVRLFETQVDRTPGAIVNALPITPNGKLDRSALPAPGDRPPAAVYPLSPIQQGLLFHSAHTPGPGVYFNQIVLDLAGLLDRAALRHVWQQIVDRHAVLRTAFRLQQEEPLQVVEKTVELPWREEDWRAVSTARIDARLEELLQADRRAGFDLDRPPLLRFILIRTPDERHRLVLSSHHLILDGWSVAVLLREALALYRDECRGVQVTPEPTRPYLDYINWLGRQDKAAAATFWRGDLAGFTTPT